MNKSPVHSDDFPVFVEITRGELVESRHRGLFAAVTADGDPVVRRGDTAWPCYLRSAAKPFQAIAVARAGALDRFDVSDAELALIAASHNGEPDHADRVASLLARLGLSADHLHCGTHPPFNSAAARILAGRPVTVFNNNCSGKHTGMLAACLAAGFPVENYEAADHPLQIAIREVIREFCDLATVELPVAPDGCTVPTWAVPLGAMALGYARLLAPDAPPEAARVANAMMAHPDLVAGTERIDTDLMRLRPGKLLSKVGAEGVHVCAVPPSDRYPRGLGVAIKIEDGDSGRARAAAILAALVSLEIITKEEETELRARYCRPLTTNRKQVVGEVRAVI